MSSNSDAVSGLHSPLSWVRHFWFVERQMLRRLASGFRHSRSNAQSRNEPSTLSTPPQAAVMSHVDGSNAINEVEVEALSGLGEEEEDDEENSRFVQQPLSAPHPTPLPMSGCDLNDEELANSLVGIAGLGDRRRVATPFRWVSESITEIPIAIYAFSINPSLRHCS